MQAHNYSIRELLNQDYQTDKEQILCEFISETEDSIQYLKQCADEIATPPTIVEIEIIIDSLPFMIADSDLGDKTREALQELIKLFAKHMGEREEWCGRVDNVCGQLDELTDY